MKIVFSALIVLLLFGGNVLGQRPTAAFDKSMGAIEPMATDTVDTADTTGFWDHLNIHQNTKTAALLHRLVNINKQKQTTEGYRVQIYFGSGSSARLKAMKVKTHFLSSYPKVTAYIIYQSPDFKVRVGDFRTRSEALRLEKKIARDYPNAFIVPDEIQFPELYNNSSFEE